MVFPAPRFSRWLWRGFLGVAACAGSGLRAQPSAPTLEQLADENRQLRAQLDAQQKIIADLKARMDAWEGRHAAAVPAAPAPAVAAPEENTAAPAPSSLAASAAALRISAEMGLAYFQSGADGDFARGIFRLDEGRIYLEAPVVGNAYFHGELDLETREAGDDGTHYGEVYADFEDVPGPWGAGAVNVRAGRINIPFGEEYMNRNVMENPLIAHSLSDLWGFDGGVEAYGSAGGFNYVAALLSGSIDDLRSGHSSLSAAARLGYDFGKAWGVSASVMRTGRLSAAGDGVSAVWFGNGFFVPLAGATQFWANLAEGDVHAAWTGGHVRAAVGAAWYRDNNPLGGSGRRIDYGYIEAVQNVSEQLYAALRCSRIAAPGGYPIAGDGRAGEYVFGGVLTRRLERVTVGAGYRFGDPLVLKVDYSPEWGSTVGHGGREGEDLFATELALKF